MDPRRWWLLAGALPVVLACVVAAGAPALRPVADLAVAVAGVGGGAAIWVIGSRRTENRTSWRLFAVATGLPVLGVAVTFAVDPPDPLEFVVLRWVPTVPAFALGVVALLALVRRARLPVGKSRVVVELALFSTACLVTMQLLIVGPGGRWSDLVLGERVVLGAAVVTTSAMMAAALTVLGVIEGRRQRMALVFLLAAVLLSAGRGLGTSARLSGALGAVDVSRLMVVTGLGLLVLAVLVAPGPETESDESTAAGRSTELGQVLPHIALVVAVTAVGIVSLAGHRPSAETVAGAVLCVVLAAVHRWITAQDGRHLAARLRRSEAYFRSLIRSSGDAVVILDDAMRISWASSALERALGSAAADLVGRRLLDAVHPDDVSSVAATLPTVAGDASDTPAGLLLLRLQDAAGEWRYLEAALSDLRHVADVGAVVLHCRDMTDRHAREQALQSVAYLDSLTGLPNRAGLLQALASSPAGNDEPGTLLMIELDGLVAAREHAGREVVGTVVAEAGRRLRAAVRGEDVVARMGGGAFAILAAGTDADADRLADRCLAVIEQPIPTSAGIVDLTADVGLVPLEPGLSVEEVLCRGDLAVRTARAGGPGRAARYSALLGEAAQRRDRLRADLQGAVARGELFLLFQPILSLQEPQITGIEAQLRWRHATLGEIPPAEFVPIAEQGGLIGDLVRWALGEVTSLAVALSSGADGTRPEHIGLTVPAGYVATGTMVADVERALTRSGLPPERLVLQIGADTVMSEDERAGLDVSTLRLMGVHVALDGFGSGSSALAHLTRMPIDVVKLDRSLVHRIDRDAQSRALCESVIGIVRALNLDVVAEGVDTPAELAALSAAGCTYAQGFLLGRPMPLAELTAMLTDGAGPRWSRLVGAR